MRLIDADALLEVLNEYREEYDGKDANGFYNLKYCAIMEAILAIDNAPTVAAAPEVQITDLLSRTWYKVDQDDLADIVNERKERENDNI